MAYYYKKTEQYLWTVGTDDYNDKWYPESDHDSKESAAARVHFLNGGTDYYNTMAETIAALTEKIEVLEAQLARLLEAVPSAGVKK